MALGKHSAVSWYIVLVHLGLMFVLWLLHNLISARPGQEEKLFYLFFIILFYIFPFVLGYSVIILAAYLLKRSRLQRRELIERLESGDKPEFTAKRF